MDIKNELLGNEDFVAKTLKSLIEQEFRRVIDTGLISKAECYAFIEKHRNSNETRIQNLLSAYTSLSNIKLAGDKLEEDKFYDLSSISDKLKSVEPKPECKCEPGECVGSDCPCPENCVCKDSKKLMVDLKKLENLISVELEKIAYIVGRTGDHEAAYRVERTLREIKATIQNGAVFNYEDDTEQLSERNKALVSEAESLFTEFKSKFNSVDYFPFIKALRSEMRTNQSDDPKIAAQSLRSKWNTK